MQGNRYLRHMERVRHIKTAWTELSELALDHGEIELAQWYRDKENEVEVLLNNMRDKYGR
jgi:hypothetical protein